MRYHPPAGSALPNAPYVGKNIALQQQGSRIPPQVPEYTQREIVNVVELSGQSPTDDDLSQVARAIRTGMLSTFVDTSATPGTITVGSPLLLTTYNEGLPFVVRLNQAVTGPTLLNFNGMGPRPVVHSGGGALQRGDYRKDDLIELRYNAKRQELVMLTPVSEGLINAPTIKTVGGFNPDFLDLYEAAIWLSRRRISYTGYVSFQHAAGVGNSKFIYASDVRISHPDGARFALKGFALNGSLPGAAALRFTGTDAASRVSDTRANVETMRGIFNTEIGFVAGARLIISGDIDLFQDFLFTSDGSGPVKTSVFQGYGASNVVLENGVHNVRRIASTGAQLQGLLTRGGQTNFGEQNFFFGNGSYGATFGNNTVVLANASIAALSNGIHGFQSGVRLDCDDFTTSQVYARGNTDSGVSANTGVFVGSSNCVLRDNGGSGCALVNCAAANMFGTAVLGNPYGLVVGRLSYADAQAMTGSATNTAFYAYNGGQIVRNGSSVSAPTQASPAAGSSGNGNAFVV